MRNAAESLCLAAGLALPEVLDGKDGFNAVDVIVDRKLTDMRLLAGNGNHRHQPRALRKQRVVTLPVATLSGRTGEDFVRGMQDAIEGGDIGFNGWLHRS